MLFDAALAEHAGIDVGDSVTIVTGGVERALDVVGLGYDFSDCLYPTAIRRTCGSARRHSRPCRTASQ